MALFQSETQIENKIHFLHTDGTTKKYIPKNIKAYSHDGKGDFITVREGLVKYFAEILVNGEYILAKMKYSSDLKTTNPNTFGGINNAPHPNAGREIHFLIHPTTSFRVKIKRAGFKNQMANYFANYPKLRQEILSRKLRYKDLEDIVETYNNWFDEQN